MRRRLRKEDTDDLIDLYLDSVKMAGFSTMAEAKEAFEAGVSSGSIAISKRDGLRNKGTRFFSHHCSTQASIFISTVIYSYASHSSVREFYNQYYKTI